MRWRAKVVEATGASRHFAATVVDGQPVATFELPTPDFVEISAEGSGYFLFRLDSSGQCIADTWHQTLDEAKQAALEEYRIQLGDWHAIEPS